MVYAMGWQHNLVSSMSFSWVDLIVENLKWIVNSWDKWSHRLPLQGVNFKLLNTRSLDKFDRSDSEVLTEIAEQLLDQESIGQPISGIIYCHPAEDRIFSGATQRNMRAVIELFLGRQELHRLTILVLPTTGVEQSAEVAVRQLMGGDSLVFNKAHVGGATIVAGKWSLDDFSSHLQRFCSIPPFRPPVCQALTGEYSAQHYVGNAMGYYTKQSMESHATALNRQTIDANRELEEQVACYKAEFERRATHQCTTKDPLDNVLRERLRQTEKEYASLRSQVQLQNGYEQGEIVRDLNKINDMVARVSQSISEHLVDVYSQSAFNKSHTEVTLSDARDISKLEAWLQERRGQMSLLPNQATLSSGECLSADNFLDFLFRAHLCKTLDENIFRPFHPLIEPDESARFDGYYREVQQQEHQYTAGRWRSITFRMLGSQKTSEEHIHRVLQEFVAHLLKPLAKYFFALSDISLGEHHYDDLFQVFHASWEWSSRVKTEVIMLGDFCPVTLVPGPFNSNSMVEFETYSHAPHSKFVLSTLGLGLVVREARGGGILPDETVLLKTKVLTDAYYTSN
ncbi:unnamed protein product [Rhizoctonia solani]|uniref:Uncharacterized protein n=1 Tax=Rhizoctonia solani TaxID=456999 RepID=A0A8H3CL45_9AGAM|nr:unnamed protein product [Rhizoctonia solani]